ncbi:hypothetical protein SKAU_G00237860 [Synaphobranchus kaupii]|uniref:Uncharacterized protein n=1 Tax=Synaphobranchus kaupii TaxID=118154 RepID=A0A9Q1F718_SYNKA|nr:hypothetical protein SKAU_G00237860 [Synaphobranchus kaupii]
MKDVALSLLSRGFGHVVQTEVDSQGGRIEVYFEPEDYFNWKSQQPVLRLSDSGRIRCGEEPTPPKTYSTRRGPLLLYSADLALPCNPEDASRKRRGSQHSVQEVELRLRSLRDLTGAILAYDKKQVVSDVVHAQRFPPLSPASPMAPSVTQLSHTWYPTISPCDPEKPAGGDDIEDPQSVNCLSTPPDSRQIPCSENSPQCQTAQRLSSISVIYDNSKDQPVPPNPTPCDWEDETGFLLHPRPYTVPRDPLPPITEGIAKNLEDARLTSAENQTGDVEDHSETNKLCLRIVVDTPKVQMSPIPERERTDWRFNSKNNVDRQDGPVLHNVTDCPGYQGAHGKCRATGAGEVEERPCPLKRAFVDSSWSCSHLSRVTYYGGHLSGTRLGTNCVPDRKGAAAPDSTLHLPPVPSGPLLKPTPLIWSGPDKGGTGAISQMKTVGPLGLQKQVGTVRLPPLSDSNISPGTPALTRPQSPGAPTLRPVQSPEDPGHNRPQRELHRKMLLLPLLEHGGYHDTHAADGMLDICEDFGPDKEIAKIGGTNRESSPTPPAMEPKNRGSSPTPAIQPKNRASSPTPVIQPKGVNLDGLSLLEPGKENSPFLGVFPPLGGRKGPGKQSSMALFRQDPLTGPNDCCDPDNLQTAVVRGIVPVELRDWEKVGTLIMGPDGEIIQLSFWGHSTDTDNQQLLDDITRERALSASEAMQDQPWNILLQTDTGTLVSDAFGLQANMNPSALNKQDGVGRDHPHGQQGAGESQGLYLVNEEQSSLPKRPGEMASASAFSHHTTDQQGEEGMEETWDHQSGTWKSSKGPRPRKGAPSNDPSASALTTGGGNTTGAFSPNKQSHKTTAGALSGQSSQSSQELDKTSVAAQEAKRNRAGQQEVHARNRKETEGEQLFGETLTEATGNSTLSKRKAKGLKEKPQNGSSSQARDKRKGKQRPFVVGKAQESASERLADERMGRAGGLQRRLDGMNSDGLVTDKDQGQRRGASSTTLGGSVNDGDPSGAKLNTPASQSNRAQGSDRLSSPDLRNESACSDHPSSLMKGQSPATYMMKGQSPAASMRNSQSSAVSMMKCQSPTVSLSESQLALRVAATEASHVNHDWEGGSRRHSMARMEQQGIGRTGRADQRRAEVERKRAEREEQRKREQQEKEERGDRMKQEILKEQEQRAEEHRRKRMKEQEERQQQEERETEHIRKQQSEREKDKKRQEEKKRQMERFLRIRQEEEERKAVELQHLRVEERQRREEERRMLQDMDEDERQAYLLQRHKEEEQRQREAEERKRREGEAAIARHEAMLQLVREWVVLEQRLQSQRRLQEEVEGLEQTQSISRPWVYSYFGLLNILGLQDPPTAPEDSTSDTC